MFLCLNDQYRNTVVVNVVDNAVFCSASFEYSTVYLISCRSISASLLGYGMKCAIIIKKSFSAAKVQNIFEKQVYLMQNNIIILGDGVGFGKKYRIALKTMR